jgi:hypothetical protein
METRFPMPYRAAKKFRRDHKRSQALMVRCGLTPTSDLPPTVHLRVPEGFCWCGQSKPTHMGPDAACVWCGEPLAPWEGWFIGQWSKIVPL